jgi:hypothetical protein
LLWFKKDCQHYFGRILVDGYQYCIKCNLAVKPQDQQPECLHKWNRVKTVDVKDEWEDIVGHRDVLQCTLCGEMKSFLIKELAGHERSWFDVSRLVPKPVLNKLRERFKE